MPLVVEVLGERSLKRIRGSILEIDVHQRARRAHLAIVLALRAPDHLPITRILRVPYVVTFHSSVQVIFGFRVRICFSRCHRSTGRLRGVNTVAPINQIRAFVLSYGPEAIPTTRFAVPITYFALPSLLCGNPLHNQISLEGVEVKRAKHQFFLEQLKTRSSYKRTRRYAHFAWCWMLKWYQTKRCAYRKQELSKPKESQIP
ncbi:hypothetical protein BOTBODRAFT_411796 [Botryobasidium botryosum FD-172 SS1]|uniref:Uncharacterized protein n=1 Tax=Botryobasidium botryosum (strain FD-172 SS1) TaxID=930990 RepID=A0A067M9U5_BOTB1|nr:hypothetical protein BOTBODRAFT_411796 [Botryobasidium botryosum FD-172 SS1]